MGTPYSKLLDWWHNLVLYQGNSLELGVLSTCRGAVNIFYGPSRLDRKFVLQNILIRNEGIIVFMLLYYNTQQLILLSYFVCFYLWLIDLFKNAFYFSNFLKIISSLNKVFKKLSPTEGVDVTLFETVGFAREYDKKS